MGGRAGAGPVHSLVTGRSASIFEIKAQVERLTLKPVRYRLDTSYGNSADITFQAGLAPRLWNPCSLEVGMRRMLMSMGPSG